LFKNEKYVSVIVSRSYRYSLFFVMIKNGLDFIHKIDDHVFCFFKFE